MNDTPVLFVVGATHHTTPLELREKLALPSDQLPLIHQELTAVPGLREVAVLNTCNRVEFYGVAQSAGTITALERYFCQRQALPLDDFHRIRMFATGDGAVRHLLEVASGLDSQMLGENEIFGQIKSAYAEARSRQTAGPVLNRMFQKGFQAAKYIRTHTALTEGHVSIANVAVDLATTIFGSLDRARVLLLGAGEIGEKTARALQSRGARQLTVSSRTLERAMELAQELAASALAFEHVSRHLADFDIIVSATAAPHAILTAGTVGAALARRPTQPLFLIDLALPRDIEPAAADHQNVFLYNLDDLARIADANRAAREAEVGKARTIVAERTVALWQTIARSLGA